jgi:HSP20 family protein
MSNQTEPQSNEAAAAEQTSARMPAYHVREADQKLYVHVELPGASREEIEIQLEGTVLSVRAKAAGTAIPADFSPLRAEFAMGDYEAEFRVPAWVNQECVGAQYENGIEHRDYWLRFSRHVR